jgi:ABC-type antimicrobial peptide transport system permease subunit
VTIADRQEFERLLQLCWSGAGPEAIPSIRKRIEEDRRVQLDVFEEKEYFASQTSAAQPIQILGYLVGVIMAVGSCFAVMNTMYAATTYRTREIATLRVLGFKRHNIHIVLVKSIVAVVAFWVIYWRCPSWTPDGTELHKLGSGLQIPDHANADGRRHGSR